MKNMLSKITIIVDTNEEIVSIQEEGCEPMNYLLNTDSFESEIYSIADSLIAYLSGEDDMIYEFEDIDDMIYGFIEREDE